MSDNLLSLRSTNVDKARVSKTRGQVECKALDKADFTEFAEFQGNENVLVVATSTSPPIIK
jgi:hypothetical protein